MSLVNCGTITVADAEVFNLCEYFSGGVKRLFIANYEDNFESRIQIVNEEVSDISGGSVWFEIRHDNFTANYEQRYDYDKELYINRLAFDIIGWVGNRRIPADRLVKGRFAFVFEDYNNRWWLVGITSAMKSVEANFLTGSRRGRNEYKYVYENTEKLPAVQLSEAFVEEVIDGSDCSDSYTELALSSVIFLPVFEDCLVCCHPDSNLVCQPGVVCF